MKYLHLCIDCGQVEISCSMAEAKEIMDCPLCGLEAKRIYVPIADVWKTSGGYSKKSHKGE